MKERLFCFWQNRDKKSSKSLKFQKFFDIWGDGSKIRGCFLKKNIYNVLQLALMFQMKEQRCFGKRDIPAICENVES